MRSVYQKHDVVGNRPEIKDPRPPIRIFLFSFLGDYNVEPLKLPILTLVTVALVRVKGVKGQVNDESFHSSSFCFAGNVTIPTGLKQEATNRAWPHSLFTATGAHFG